MKLEMAVAETQKQIEMCETQELKETMISNCLASFIQATNEQYTFNDKEKGCSPVMI